MNESGFSFKLLTFRNFVAFAVIANLLVVISVIFFLSSLPPEVPLFYGLAEGEEQLAKNYFLVIPGVLSIAIIVINSILSFSVRDSFFKKALILGGVATSFFAVITTLKIMFLVGSF